MCKENRSIEIDIKSKVLRLNIFIKKLITTYQTKTAN